MLTSSRRHGNGVMHILMSRLFALPGADISVSPPSTCSTPRSPSTEGDRHKVKKGDSILGAHAARVPACEGEESDSPHPWRKSWHARRVRSQAYLHAIACQGERDRAR